MPNDAIAEMREQIAAMPGLKEDALVKLGTCAVCKKPQLGREAMFYCVTIERAMFSQSAIQRRVGLNMMFGGHDALARAFSPNEDLAKIYDGPHKVFVHEACAGDIGHLLLLVPPNNDAEKTDAA